MAAAALVVVWAFATTGCSKSSRAATTEQMSSTPTNSLTNSVKGDCGHAACGNNFFVDVAAPASCAVDAPCGLTLTLVATGDYHINEEYPYKFEAEEAKGVTFLGTDPAGKNIFSKNASNWQKKDEKTGAMSVAFRGSERGDKAISGTFKLSVCAAERCQLEREAVSTTIAIR